MANKLRECVLELHKNHIGKEVAEAFSEYFRTVETIAEAYTDGATARDLRAECPNLDFMHDNELETILEHAQTWRRKGDGQEPAQPERGPDGADERPQGMEELCQKRMEESQRREDALLAYAYMVAENRHDETEALLSALGDKPPEAKYKDYWEYWGDEESEGGKTYGTNISKEA